MVAAARTMMFTHQERTAHAGNEFFARVAFRVSRDSFVKTKVKQALDKVAEATDPSRSLSKEEFVDDLALTSMARLWDVGKTEPIKVGKASPTEGTLPGSIYFIVKYSTLEQEGKIDNAYSAAASANAEVGGDNASRSIVIGMVLGAWSGVDAIPKKVERHVC